MPELLQTLFFTTLKIRMRGSTPQQLKEKSRRSDYANFLRIMNNVYVP